VHRCVFDNNAEVFDIHREKVSIGASLARMEAKVAFEKLLAQFPDMRLQDAKPHWGRKPFFRGHETLLVSKQ
jgi:cytochrome P450